MNPLVVRMSQYPHDAKCTVCNAIPAMHPQAYAPNMVCDKTQFPSENMGEVWWFWCPGCDQAHMYTTKRAKGEAGPVWTFNNNLDKPSFQASLLQRSTNPPEGNSYRRKNAKGDTWVCHLFVTDGQINYCSDSSHELAGKSVPLPPVPDWLLPNNK